jgi:hypothetical protein
MINFATPQYRDLAVRIKDCDFDSNLQLIDTAHVERIEIARITKLDHYGLSEPADGGGAEIKCAYCDKACESFFGLRSLQLHGMAEMPPRRRMCKNVGK